MQRTRILSLSCIHTCVCVCVLFLRAFTFFFLKNVLRAVSNYNFTKTNNKTSVLQPSNDVIAFLIIMRVCQAAGCTISRRLGVSPNLNPDLPLAHLSHHQPLHNNTRPFKSSTPVYITLIVLAQVLPAVKTIDSFYPTPSRKIRKKIC